MLHTWAANIRCDGYYSIFWNFGLKLNKGRTRLVILSPCIYALHNCLLTDTALLSFRCPLVRSCRLLVQTSFADPAQLLFLQTFLMCILFCYRFHTMCTVGVSRIRRRSPAKKFGPLLWLIIDVGKWPRGNCATRFTSVKEEKNQ